MPKHPSKLAETKNFLELYLHAAGTSEVPTEYHIWSCLSLLAAVAGNRVWHEKFPTKKMHPNLYIMLIGPSGGGKGEAIDFALRFLKELPEINVYRGKVTGAAMADAFTRPTRDEEGKIKLEGDPNLYLITPELSMSVGEGPIARDFVRRMTELYTGGDYEYREATRTHGEISFRNPCLKGDAEVLTRSGWQRLDQIHEEDEILQWEENNHLTWASMRLTRLRYEGWLIQWSTEMHDCSYTPDHRIVLFGGRGRKQHRVLPARDAARIKEFSIPVSGLFTGVVRERAVKLLCAIQADGSIDRRRVFFGLKKPRKIVRLKQICKSLGIEVRELSTGSSGQWRCSIGGPVVERLITLLGKPKRFGAWLLNFDAKTLDELLEEVVWWDGHESRAGAKRNGYSSAPLQNAEWVATIAHLRGRVAYLKERSSAWYVTLRQQRTITLDQPHEVPFNGYVYCVTVPTGFFLARSNGKIFVTGNCINWIAGTTRQWLLQSVERSAIESGFFARAIPIEASYDPEKRHPDPKVPPDFAEVCAYLVKRLERILHLEGKFEFSNQAHEIKDHWYLTRPAPDDPALLPSWKRQDDLVRKLAMVLSLAARDDLVMNEKHVKQAQALVHRAHAGLPDLIAFASQSLGTANLSLVANFIMRAKRIPHSSLLKKVSHRGIQAKELAIHVDTLRQRRDIAVDTSNGSGRTYVWKGQTVVFG